MIATYQAQPETECASCQAPADVVLQVGTMGVHLCAECARTVQAGPPPDVRASLLQDRVHPASGRLLASHRLDTCSLCTAVATVHLPPELGASALCRACADRVRAALEPPAEAEQEVLANLGCRASRVPLLPRCPDCSRG